MIAKEWAFGVRWENIVIPGAVFIALAALVFWAARPRRDQTDERH
jgi:hypothetical protein